MPIRTETHNEPFAHASWTRPSILRGAETFLDSLPDSAGHALAGCALTSALCGVRMRAVINKATDSERTPMPIGKGLTAEPPAVDGTARPCTTDPNICV